MMAMVSVMAVMAVMAAMPVVPMPVVAVVIAVVLVVVEMSRAAVVVIGIADGSVVVAAAGSEQHGGKRKHGECA